MQFRGQYRFAGRVEVGSMDKSCQRQPGIVTTRDSGNAEWTVYPFPVSFGYNFVIFHRIFLKFLHNLPTHVKNLSVKHLEDLTSKPPVMSYGTKTAILDFRPGKNYRNFKLLKFDGRLSQTFRIDLLSPIKLVKFQSLCRGK